MHENKLNLNENYTVFLYRKEDKDFLTALNLCDLRIIKQ